MLYNKLQRVRSLLREASRRTENFRKKVSLSCVPGCYSCCLKKDLYASPLEFFPLAYDLCREGNGEKAYCKSGSIGKTSPCMFFSPFNKPGGCTRYNDRGLICRLFGFSSNADKNGCPRLICCRNIKKTQAFCNLTDKDISGSPEFSDFYIRLESIDFALANEQLQINLAINKALEVILNYESLHMHRIPA